MTSGMRAGLLIGGTVIVGALAATRSGRHQGIERFARNVAASGVVGLAVGDLLDEAVRWLATSHGGRPAPGVSSVPVVGR